MPKLRPSESTVHTRIASGIDMAAIQRRTLIVLAISQIIGTVGVGVAPSIGVLLAEQVTASEAWAGLARTASTLGAALVGLPLGNLAARRGRRIALSLGWWIAGIGAAILVAAAQWSLPIPLFVGLLLIGAGSAVTLQARFAATDLAQPGNKARSLSLIVWVGTLGMVLGPNLGVPGEIIGRSTGLTVFAAAFLIAAVFFAVAGAIVYVLLRPDPLFVLTEVAEQGDSRAGSLPAGQDSLAGNIRTTTQRKDGGIRNLLAELRTHRRSRYSVIAIVTAQIVMVSIMTMTPVHIAHHGGSVTIIGMTISLHIAGMYVLAPLVGMLADRWGFRFAIATGIVIFFVSLAIVVLRPGSTTWIVVSLILLGVGWSFVNVSASALFSSVVSPESRASAQGGVDALANLSGAIAAFAAGPLLAATSFPTISIVSMVILVPLTVLTFWRNLTIGSA